MVEMFILKAPCPSCENVMCYWNDVKKRGPHVCAECETGEDLGLTKLKGVTNAEGS